MEAELGAEGARIGSAEPQLQIPDAPDAPETTTAALGQAPIIASGLVDVPEENEGIRDSAHTAAESSSENESESSINQPMLSGSPSIVAGNWSLEAQLGSCIVDTPTVELAPQVVTSSDSNSPPPPTFDYLDLATTPSTESVQPMVIAAPPNTFDSAIDAHRPPGLDAFEVAARLSSVNADSTLPTGSKHRPPPLHLNVATSSESPQPEASPLAAPTEQQLVEHGDEARLPEDQENKSRLAKIAADERALASGIYLSPPRQRRMGIAVKPVVDPGITAATERPISRRPLADVTGSARSSNNQPRRGGLVTREEQEARQKAVSAKPHVRNSPAATTPSRLVSLTFQDLLPKKEQETQEAGRPPKTPVKSTRMDRMPFNSPLPVQRGRAPVQDRQPVGEQAYPPQAPIWAPAPPGIPAHGGLMGASHYPAFSNVVPGAQKYGMTPPIPQQRRVPFSSNLSTLEERASPETTPDMRGPLARATSPVAAVADSQKKAVVSRLQTFVMNEHPKEEPKGQPSAQLGSRYTWSQLSAAASGGLVGTPPNRPLQDSAQPPKKFSEQNRSLFGVKVCHIDDQTLMCYYPAKEPVYTYWGCPFSWCSAEPVMQLDLAIAHVHSHAAGTPPLQTKPHGRISLAPQQRPGPSAPASARRSL